MNLAKRMTTTKNKVNNFPMPPKSILYVLKLLARSSFTDSLRLVI